MRVRTQEHNTMSPARTQTLSTRSGVEHTNHEAATPHIVCVYIQFKSFKLMLDFEAIKNRFFSTKITVLASLIGT